MLNATGEGRERESVPRPYRLGKRAIGVAATRQRIMDATRELLETGGIEQANIQAIAKEAGVTRPTVYQQFGTHSELLLAVMNDALDRADVRSVRKALQLQDAGKAVRGVIRGSCRFWDSEATLFRRFKGLSLVDEAASGGRSAQGRCAARPHPQSRRADSTSRISCARASRGTRRSSGFTC